MISERTTATYSLKQPFEFEYKGTDIILEKLVICFTPRAKWFSLIVEIDAGLGTYDYLRGKVRFTPGPNSYTMGVDLDKGKPLSSAPELPGGLLPGEVELQVATFRVREGFNFDAVPPLDELIIPADLDLRAPPKPQTGGLSAGNPGPALTIKTITRPKNTTTTKA